MPDDCTSFNASISRDLMTLYINTQLPSSERTSAEKLFLAEDKGFLYALEENDGDYVTVLREFIASYPRGKTEAMLRLREFVTWLSSRTRQDLRIDWPQVDLDERFERIIAITRLLQGQPPMTEKDTVDFLCERLWVSERTIREDFKVMREGLPGGINSALSQSFQIDGLSENRRPIEFLSSAHPLFLMENVSGVICLLEGLLEKSLNPLRASFCMETANHIWSQLTDYARSRVTDMIHQDYPAPSPVLDRFQELVSLPRSTAFASEQSLLQGIPDTLWFNTKTSRRCWVTWVDEAGEPRMESGIPYPPVTDEDWEKEIFHFEKANGERFDVPLSAITSISEAVQLEAELQ